MSTAGAAGPAGRARPAHRSPRLVLLVAAGGLVGAPARYGLARVLPGAGSSWPTATFVTNLLGAFVLGVLLEALARRGPDEGGRRLVRLAVGTGVVGAFTTYSTFVVEVDRLLAGGRPGTAVAYALGTVVGGVLLAGAGVAVAVRARRRG